VLVGGGCADVLRTWRLSFQVSREGRELRFLGPSILALCRDLLKSGQLFCSLSSGSALLIVFFLSIPLSTFFCQAYDLGRFLSFFGVTSFHCKLASPHCNLLILSQLYVVDYNFSEYVCVLPCAGFISCLNVSGSPLT